MRSLLVVLVLASSWSCAATHVPLLARAEVASDFETYAVERVGVMPFQGEDVDVRRGRDLQLSLYGEFSRGTPFELVLLDAQDLEEVRGSEPHRRGWYRPLTIIEASRRYNLDAILFGTVVSEQLFAPQSLSTQVDLVAAETGLVIWSASVHLDATDPRVREGLERYFGAVDGGSQPWEVSLVSPSRFARFAAYQVASLL